MGEAKSIKDQRMVDHFNTLNPKSEERTLKSFGSRWAEMQVFYKFYALYKLLNDRYICDFNAGHVPGLTGKGDWWLLPRREQKHFLNPSYLNANGTPAKRPAPKGKVCQITTSLTVDLDLQGVV